MNLTLPYRPDREALLGFTLALALVLGSALAAAAVLLGLLSVAASLALGGVAGGAVAVVGLRRERIADLAYRAWNRLARGYAGMARRAVTAIWYWTVFTVVARTDAHGMRLDGTQWVARGTQAPGDYHGQGGLPPSGEETGVGLREFSRWAIGSGRSWALVLVPLLVLLRSLDARDPKAPPPSDMYTLY